MNDRMCRDCSLAYRVDDQLYEGVWQLNCQYRYGVTYDQAGDCEHYETKREPAVTRRAEQLSLFELETHNPLDCENELSVVAIGGGKTLCAALGMWTNCREVGHCTAGKVAK